MASLCSFGTPLVLLLLAAYSSLLHCVSLVQMAHAVLSHRRVKQLGRLQAAPHGRPQEVYVSLLILPRRNGRAFPPTQQQPPAPGAMQFKKVQPPGPAAVAALQNVRHGGVRKPAPRVSCVAGWGGHHCLVSCTALNQGLPILPLLPIYFPELHFTSLLFLSSLISPRRSEGACTAARER